MSRLKHFLVFWLLGLLISVQGEGNWQRITNGALSGPSDPFEFDPQSSGIEYRFVGDNVVELSDLAFTVTTRFFNMDDDLLGLTSFIYKMDGRRITKSWLRVGVRANGKQRYCIDEKSWDGAMPSSATIDVNDPSVFLLNGKVSAGFHDMQCRYMKKWRDAVAGGEISRASVVVYDPRRTTRNTLSLEYRVVSLDEVPTEGRDNFVVDGTDSNESAREDPAEVGPVCSVYPPGIIDTFAGESVHYDLKCTHVLAADVGYSDSWFVYGNFDVFDGKLSLASITFYVNDGAFEIQRGWMIAYLGEKFKIREGEMRVIPLTGCEVLFENLELTVDCRPAGVPFVARYDGYMIGHIQLSEEGDRNMGLCFGPSNGQRVNWQIPSHGECGITAGERAPCDITFPECDVYGVACDASTVRMCNEMMCHGATATPEQMCSMDQAAQTKCALTGGKIPSLTDHCPVDVCVRKFFVLGTGCPQDPFFTGCPIEKYIV